MSPLPPLRLARASVFSAVCVLLTCLGHWTASGRPMSAGPVAAAFAGTLGVAFVLAGHERSWATILGGLLGGQFLLHALFTTGSAAHHAGGRLPPSMDASDASNGLGMTLAHLLAAVLSAWWLRRGERRAWRLARLASRALLRPLLLFLGLPVVQDGPVLVPAEPAPARPRTTVLRHALVLRGPPADSRAF